MTIFWNNKVRELELKVSTLEATVAKYGDEIFQLNATNEKNAVEIAAKDKRIIKLEGDIDAKEREITKLLNEAQLRRM